MQNVTLKTEVFTNWDQTIYQKATLKNHEGIYFVGIAPTSPQAIELAFTKARAFNNSLKTH